MPVAFAVSGRSLLIATRFLRALSQSVSAHLASSNSLRPFVSHEEEVKGDVISPSLSLFVFYSSDFQLSSEARIFDKYDCQPKEKLKKTVKAQRLLSSDGAARAMPQLNNAS